MNVRVVPKRPIPGILPKNKWIDVEMELDLNESEIRRCMQYGIVYYNDEPIKDLNLCILSENKPSCKVEIVNETNIDEVPFTVITPVFKGPEPIYKAEDIESPVIEEYIEEVVVEKLVDEPVIMGPIEVIDIINTLKEVSCVREDNYIILELQFNTNIDKLENMIGMFKINSGSKIEYKSDSDKWVKFNHKFNTFEKLGDNTKFVFRFNPSHKSLLKYHLTLKQEKENGFEVNLDGTIDQSNL